MQRTKFILGGLLILAAVVYLIVSSTQASWQPSRPSAAQPIPPSVP